MTLAALAFLLRPYRASAAASITIGGGTDLTRTLKVDNKSDEWESIVSMLLVQKQKQVEEQQRIEAERAAEARRQLIARQERERLAKLRPVIYGNSYSFGNCTYYVASRRSVPSNWGNAKTWLYYAQAAGLPTGNLPQVGAIAWTGAGPLGHVAIVEEVTATQVRISEMNYVGYNVVSTRWTPIGSFLYIY